MNTRIVIAAIIALVTAGLLFIHWISPGGSYNYQGNKITPQIISKHCPPETIKFATRFIRIENIEGRTGGQETIQFEIKPKDLQAFLDSDIIKDIKMNERSIPIEFQSSDWLPPKRAATLKNSRSFQAGTKDTGDGQLKVLLIDTSNTEAYTVYLRIAS